ncbi:MAG TPA: SPASM domain-containing protein, partial [Treponemataceae bacterium]|nr:SPASM domain-containing protein [Treponemataceae bacterium]
QKYNSIGGLLKDRRVANLEPLQRNPCWHLRRDMCILVEGTVPVCREAPFAKKANKQQFLSCGNVFASSLEDVFNNGIMALQAHIDKQYSEHCKACDEYYTFNF